MALVKFSDYYSLDFFDRLRRQFDNHYIADELTDISDNARRLKKHISLVYLPDRINLVRAHKEVFLERGREAAWVKSLDKDRLHPISVYGEVYNQIRRSGTAAEGYDIMPIEVISGSVFIMSLKYGMELVEINATIPPKRRKPKKRFRQNLFPELIPIPVRIPSM